MTTLRRAWRLWRLVAAIRAALSCLTVATVVVGAMGGAVWFTLGPHHPHAQVPQVVVPAVSGPPAPTTPPTVPPLLVVPSAPATPAPTAAVPETTPTPSPIPTVLEQTSLAPVGPLWTDAECKYADSTLATDGNLDAAASTSSSMPSQQQSYYAAMAAQWQQLDTAATAYCSAGQVTALGPVVEQNAQVWFAAAYQTHVADAAAHPENMQWDQRWETIYATLEDLFRRAGAPVSPIDQNGGASG